MLWSITITLKCVLADIEYVMFSCGSVDVSEFNRKFHIFSNIITRNLHLCTFLHNQEIQPMKLKYHLQLSWWQIPPLLLSQKVSQVETLAICWILGLFAKVNSIKMALYPPNGEIPVKISWKIHENKEKIQKYCSYSCSYQFNFFWPSSFEKVYPC